MLSLLADAQATYLLIAVLGSGGIVGAITGFVRLPRERDNLAVSQAQGAMETMETLNEALERSLQRAEARGDVWKSRYLAMLAERNDLLRNWGPFPGLEIEDVPDEPQAG